MTILIQTSLFYPSIGGTETISRILAEQFTTLGHRVVVATQTIHHNPEPFPFQVVRQPSKRELLRLVKHSDIILHIGLSLKAYFPFLLYRRALVLSHHAWLLDEGFKTRLRDYIMRRSMNICVSKALAQDLKVDSYVIPNAYQNEIFYNTKPYDQRSKELVFLGRLVSLKGCDLLVRALAALKKDNLQPRLTIIGQGNLENELRILTQNLDLQEQIEFKGPLTGAALNDCLNEHKIIVVPSTWREPFGIVALEGMAAGCFPVVSAGGGLSDAIGECGLSFQNGDEQQLADSLKKALTEPKFVEKKLQLVPEHLQKHQPGSIAKAYLELFEQYIEQF